MNSSGVSEIPVFVQLPLIAWSLAWKGLALWKASKYDQKNWFIVLLVIQTVGILEIIYLFKFAKKKMQFSELQIWKNKK